MLNRRIEISIFKLLIRKKRTLAVAESCSGGLLANILTNIPGSSRFFLLGIVAYSNPAKTLLLKIPAKIIRQHGAVSIQVTKLMAQNVKKIAASDYAIGISGIAGPGGGTPEKPRGTVVISVAGKGTNLTKRFKFSGNRLEVKRKTVLKALSMLREFLKP